MITRRRWLSRAAAFTALAFGRDPPWAQANSEPPVRIVVGFAAGGNFDLVARILAPWLGDGLGQLVIVENKSGANGNIATEAVVRAAADGRTLLLGGAVNAVNASLYEKLPFDFVRDVAPVAGVVRFPNVLTVGQSFPAANVSEFIAYVKANPGKVNQGSSGNGTTQHLAGELFKMSAGLDFAHVPYRGAAQAITDLLGGQVQVLFEPLPASMPFIRAGKLRALAVTTATRVESLPDVPALGEFVPGYEASGWTGLCAPRDTPRAVVATLNRVVNAGLDDAAIHARFADLGATTIPGSPRDFGELIAAEVEKCGKVIRAAKVKPG